MRFFFYSHDGVGLGHVRRQIAIAAALQEVGPGAQVLLATSVDEVASLGLPPNVDTLKLPGIRKIANGEYSSRRLTIPKEELHRLRSGLLRVAIEGFRPDVVLVDKHPFGARGEMTVALDAAKSNGARLVLGLRDVLDDRPAPPRSGRASKSRNGSASTSIWFWSMASAAFLIRSRRTCYL